MEIEQLFIEKFRDVKKLVILAVGNEIRKDDGIGTKIVQELEGKLKNNVKLIDSGTVPESFTGVIRKFNPSHVLILDAAGMNKDPGHIQFIEKEQILGISFSTHQMPLSLIMEYMEQQLNSKIFLLGIQPVSNDFGENLSPEVEKAKNSIISILLKLFKK